MAAKFFTGLPLDGPDPECVHGAVARWLAVGPVAVPRARRSTTPSPSPSSAGPSPSAAENGSPRCHATKAGNQLSGSRLSLGST